MKLLKREDIAILIMSELVTSYKIRLVPLSHIASRHGISMQFLKKVIRNLRKNNLVLSREGVSGGYMLTKRPGDISVWDVLEAVDGTGKVSSNGDICPLYSQCLPQHINRAISGSVEKSLQRITLDTLTS